MKEKQKEPVVAFKACKGDNMSVKPQKEQLPIPVNSGDPLLDDAFERAFGKKPIQKK